MKRRGLTGFLLTVVVVDFAAVVFAIALSAVLGAFNRAAIGFFLLVAGGVLMLSGGIVGAGLPMMGLGPGGGGAGLNYANTLQSDMLLQQSMRDEEDVTGLRARRRLGLVSATSGLTLLVIAWFVIG